METTFRKYCAWGAGSHANAKPTLDRAKFQKLITECDLVDANLTRADVDIIFQKLVRKTRKMDYAQFKEGINDIASKRGVEVSEIEKAVIACQGPQLRNATVPIEDAWVAKHTDNSLYTGVHRYRFDKSGRGLGASTLETGSGYWLDRSEADIRGRKASVVAQSKRDEEIKTIRAREMEERRSKMRAEKIH